MKRLIFAFLVLGAFAYLAPTASATVRMRPIITYPPPPNPDPQPLQSAQ